MAFSWFWGLQLLSDLSLGSKQFIAFVITPQVWFHALAWIGANHLQYSAADWLMTLVAKGVYNLPISRRRPMVLTLNITSKPFGMPDYLTCSSNFSLLDQNRPLGTEIIPSIPAIDRTSCTLPSCLFLSEVTHSSYSNGLLCVWICFASGIQMQGDSLERRLTSH